MSSCPAERTIQVVSVSTACGLLYTAVDPVAMYAPSMTHHVSTGHTADGVLMHVSHALEWGSTYTRVLNFGCFFSLTVRGSTYMRIALYAGIYGILLHGSNLPRAKSARQRHHCIPSTLLVAWAALNTVTTVLSDVRNTSWSATADSECASNVQKAFRY